MYLSVQIALECFVTLVATLALPSRSVTLFFSVNINNIASRTDNDYGTSDFARGINEKKEEKGDDGKPMDKDDLIRFLLYR